MDVGADIIGIVKTNLKVFCKDTIENITKDWPRGSYLMFKSNHMVPRGRPLISIGYKYNAWGGFSFIATADTRNIKAGIPYLYKYPYPFSIVAILPVFCSLLMSNFFGSFYEVDSQNKSSQYDLVLEKFWVTQCGWLWLCTIVAMVMTNTDFWQPIHYGVKRDHCDEFISIR